MENFIRTKHSHFQMGNMLNNNNYHVSKHQAETIEPCTKPFSDKALNYYVLNMFPLDKNNSGKTFYRKDFGSNKEHLLPIFNI
ncbi:hypothetical protein GDO86_016110 [Hymenochirus boettgeri]|uniref:Uncharacterized protein n=1 Tax=Hymenochirus boettgeri TaxID=247094 RepID=A0A8T2JY91_9PIPI|nr:hypothetical protein GDO86_016110 [Hymenochirus boettgeri]